MTISEISGNAQCPAVGNDSTCGVIITVTNTGASISTTGQPPYDGIEDTLVGVVNNSSQPIRSLGLTSTLQLFGFDGDGIVSYGIPGNAIDTTGYGGPNAYFTNINSALTSGTVNFIVPIAANGGTAYFSLEESITSATACTSLINNALSGPTLSGLSLSLGHPIISATFTPNSGNTLSQAAQICGFTDFDWVQTVTRLPDPSPYYARNNGSPIHLTSASTPFNDPPAGGGYLNHAIDNSYPFYYDPSNGELAGQQTANTLSFSDRPSDSCLPGPLGLPSFAYLTNSAIRANCGNKLAPSGSSIAFTTHLAGVLSNGSAQDLGIGFTWTSNFNGTFGGVNTTKDINLPLDPGSGEGGIVVLSVEQISNYTGVVITTVNGLPPSTMLVAIAIKPGSTDPVPMNVGSRSVIPVAILASSSFDASTVNPASVRFGPTGATNTSPASLEDVNGDGRLDLVLHFRSQDTGIVCGASSATLTGQTTTNLSFTGSEAITTLGCR